MVAVRSNKEMELTPALTPIAPYKSQTGRWKRGIILRCMNDPQPEGHMASYIARRKFLATLGGAAVWPLAARAQQGERVRRIGLLMGVADDREGQARVTALKQGLQELGWTDGRNIQIETRFGGADTGRIRAHAAELVALAPDVIVTHTTPVIRALRQATS